ncbi:CAPG protein, partial [Eolophus roseicapillus]|nr:CAPG protein [Eolophus roseicapilla]
GPAAARPGLHVWRVEKLRPVEVPERSWGVFFSGDAYLVLHNGPEERAHLHLWLGRDSSQDEQGACALLSTQLNALLGERPVTHREVQGNESDLFMQYFPHGVTYQDGGVASAFKPPRPSASPGHRLYQVKGRRNIRASERDLAWSSFNTGDCFILDLGETLLVWCGSGCNVLERSRAQELAAAIRDSERRGRARLEIVADGEEPPEMLQVLGPKPTLPEGSPEEDAVADQSNARAAVSDAMGRMDLTQVAASSPFSQSLLCSDDCFVLDNGAGGKVYVWKGACGWGWGHAGTGATPVAALTSLSIGRKANEQERQAALRVAEEVIARMGHSPRTQVEILPQGHETPLFKQFFTGWNSMPLPAPCPVTVLSPAPSLCQPHPFSHPYPIPVSSPSSPLRPSHPCAIPSSIPLPAPSLFPSIPHPCVIPIFTPSPIPSLCHPYPCTIPMSLPTRCPCHSLPHPYSIPSLCPAHGNPVPTPAPHCHRCFTPTTHMPSPSSCPVHSYAYHPHGPAVPIPK